MRVRGLHSGGRDAADGRFLYVHQQHIVLVINLVVTAFAGQPFGAKHMILGCQHFRHFRVMHPLADLVAEKLRVILVGLAGQHHVVEIAQPLLETRFLPQLFILRHPLFRRNFQRGTGIEFVDERPGGFHALAENLRVIGLDFLLFLVSDRPVAQRGAVIGGALENRQMPHFPGDFGNQLHRRGPGADDANPLAGQIHPFLGPASGMTPRPPEIVNPLEIRHIMRR